MALNSKVDTVIKPRKTSKEIWLHNPNYDFQGATSGIYKKIWDEKINVNPNNFYVQGNRYEGALPTLLRVQRENFVFVADTIHAFGVVAKSGVCDVTISKDRFYKVGYAMTAQKGFPYLDMFNKA